MLRKELVTLLVLLLLGSCGMNVTGDLEGKGEAPPSTFTFGDGIVSLEAAEVYDLGNVSESKEEDKIGLLKITDFKGLAPNYKVDLKPKDKEFFDLTFNTSSSGEALFDINIKPTQVVPAIFNIVVLVTTPVGEVKEVPLQIEVKGAVFGCQQRVIATPEEMKSVFKSALDYEMASSMRQAFLSFLRAPAGFIAASVDDQNMANDLKSNVNGAIEKFFDQLLIDPEVQAKSGGTEYLFKGFSLNALCDFLGTEFGADSVGCKDFWDGDVAELRYQSKISGIVLSINQVDIFRLRMKNSLKFKNECAAAVELPLGNIADVMAVKLDKLGEDSSIIRDLDPQGELTFYNDQNNDNIIASGDYFHSQFEVSDNITASLEGFEPSFGGSSTTTVTTSPIIAALTPGDPAEPSKEDPSPTSSKIDLKGFKSAQIDRGLVLLSHEEDQTQGEPIVKVTTGFGGMHLNVEFTDEDSKIVNAYANINKEFRLEAQIPVFGNPANTVPAKLHAYFQKGFELEAVYNNDNRGKLSFAGEGAEKQGLLVEAVPTDVIDFENPASIPFTVFSDYRAFIEGIDASGLFRVEDGSTVEQTNGVLQVLESEINLAQASADDILGLIFDNFEMGTNGIYAQVSNNGEEWGHFEIRERENNTTNIVSGLGSWLSANQVVWGDSISIDNVSFATNGAEYELGKNGESSPYGDGDEYYFGDIDEGQLLVAGFSQGASGGSLNGVALNSLGWDIEHQLAENSFIASTFSQNILNLGSLNVGDDIALNSLVLNSEGAAFQYYNYSLEDDFSIDYDIAPTDFSVVSAAKDISGNISIDPVNFNSNGGSIEINNALSTGDNFERINWGQTLAGVNRVDSNTSGISLNAASFDTASFLFHKLDSNLEVEASVADTNAGVDSFSIVDGKPSLLNADLDTLGGSFRKLDRLSGKNTQLTVSNNGASRSIASIDSIDSTSVADHTIISNVAMNSPTGVNLNVQDPALAASSDYDIRNFSGSLGSWDYDWSMGGWEMSSAVGVADKAKLHIVEADEIHDWTVNSPSVSVSSMILDPLYDGTYDEKLYSSGVASASSFDVGGLDSAGSHRLVASAPWSLRIDQLDHFDVNTTIQDLWQYDITPLMDASVVETINENARVISVTNGSPIQGSKNDAAVEAYLDSLWRN